MDAAEGAGWVVTLRDLATGSFEVFRQPYPRERAEETCSLMNEHYAGIFEFSAVALGAEGSRQAGAFPQLLRTGRGEKASVPA